MALGRSPGMARWGCGVGVRSGSAWGHVPHFGYTLMAMRGLGDHSSLRMSCITEARQLDPDCHEKAQGLIHLPPGSYLQPFPAPHLPLHHFGGFSDEQFPHSVQVEVHQGCFQHLAACA